MDESPAPRIILPAMLISAILFAGVFWAFRSAKNRPGTIILPGGITYLGPSPTQGTGNKEQSAEGKIIIDQNTKWVERKGTMFPYAFSYPEVLSLGVFPNDPFDSITIFYEGTDANTNIFFRVEKLNAKPKEFAQNWWKDYAWKGVASVTEFTNSNGLKGYRAKYINDQGETPYDHVFFEVPGTPNLIIWLSGNIFTPEVFNDIVDSVAWKP